MKHASWCPAGGTGGWKYDCRCQMASPVAGLPNGRLIYADDLLNLTWREIAQVVLGIVVLLAALISVLFAISLTGVTGA